MLCAIHAADRICADDQVGGLGKSRGFFLCRSGAEIKKEIKK